jgi:mannose-6-phosphate isomerase-like protein (cupin superfamily)
MHERLTPKQALARLSEAAKQPFARVFSHGSLVVEIFKPEHVDRQHPHSRDEIYAVISGCGEFVIDGARRPFEAGEVLFVPAGVEHRFERFSEDFATWVFFYGPEGGEAR